ncbi:MAG: phenylacetate--CoA ligase family protein [Geminicoccaceae bacterium]|nr:phenylacetate--CoA ligase family protein [Geminicoccaceae bacterium]
MNPTGTLKAYLALDRQQRLGRPALQDLQEAKLRRLVRHAYATVPYYRRLFDGAGVDPKSINAVEDLGRVPLTTKADLQAAGPDAILSTAYPRDALVKERTSGSTGQPFTVRFDRPFVGIRNALFLRALNAAGYGPGQRLLLVTDERPKPPPAWMRWRYALNLDGPDALVEAFEDFRPHVVYGCVTPLRNMAIALEKRPKAWRPRAVVTTAESLHPPTRRRLKAAFGADVVDVYGLTETGMLAWECGWHTGYHLSEDTAVVDLLPEPVPGAGQPLVVTNLDLLGMPFIRYRTGDLVEPADDGPCCPCGRTLKRLSRIEGRLVDCLRLADGRAVSPYSLVKVLGPLPGLDRYRVVQTGERDFKVQFEEKSGRAPPAEGAVRGALGPLLGDDATISLCGEPTLEPPPGRKFRLVECQWGGGPGA